MGQCCTRQTNPKKQNKDIDDKRMFKFGFHFKDTDLGVGFGYNRRARKSYTDVGCYKESETEE